MLQRIIYGALAIAAVVALVAGDAYLANTALEAQSLLARGSIIPVVCGLIAIVASIELSVFFRKGETKPYVLWAAISSMVIAVSPWLIGGGVLASVSIAELLTIALLGAALIGVLKRDLPHGLANVSATWLIIAYAGLLTSFLTSIRSTDSMLGETGAWTILLLVAVCKICDIGAYFSGTLFGRHKLIPQVSPGKSVEGLIGGVLASCLLSIVFHFLQSSATNEPATLAAGITAIYADLTLTQAIVLGILIAIVGQAGDLVESLFKRSANMKDSAHILPGFGGILDMVDSPLAVAPVVWFTLARLWGVL